MTEKTIKFNEGVQNLHYDKMAELKKLLPNLFDKDGNLIKSELENFATGYTTEKQEPFCFSWAGKQKAKGLAFKESETKLAVKFDDKRGKNTSTTQNLIIEGDNLQVLKLLVPSYKGKIKCIYIDPPYNTQHEFIYPDNYATSELDYLLESGQLEEGQDISGQNAKEKNTGRKHSNWLSFMYPRLVLARELLRADGVIC
jgi:adenine-specific DNA-methyltransferase